MAKTEMATRQKILDAALRAFAQRGYAGASVREIVDAAKVTKPVLYYYFASKAALYQGLVDAAHDERYRRMLAAAGKGETLAEKLVEILAALFDFMENHRELMRLALATALAAPGEMPPEMNLQKPQRNFDWLQALIKKELAAGKLSRRFDANELTMGIWGLMNIYVLRQLAAPQGRVNRKTAERMVELFLHGAMAQTGMAKAPRALPAAPGANKIK